jgi:5'-deoxynucleotidase YfbR-like HD superfamily hydrolase
MEEMKMTWVQTVSGVAFDLLAPRAEDVRAADIAHSLARINRFSGHTLGEPYSVAHHSMLVADILASWGCPVAIVREGLLHDAPEAYYGDTVSPVAAAMRAASNGAITALPDVLRARQRIDRVVRAALALPENETAIVKRADLVALAIERRDLMAPCERDWQLPEYAPMTPRLDCGMLPRWNEVRDSFAKRWREFDEACGVSR